MQNKEKVEHIKSLLDEKEPERCQAEERLAPLKSHLQSEIKEGEYYRVLEDKSTKIQSRGCGTRALGVGQLN